MDTVALNCLVCPCQHDYSWTVLICITTNTFKEHIQKQQHRKHCNNCVTLAIACAFVISGIVVGGVGEFGEFCVRYYHEIIIGENDGKKLEQIQKWLQYDTLRCLWCSSYMYLYHSSCSFRLCKVFFLRFKTSAFVYFCIVVLLHIFCLKQHQCQSTWRRIRQCLRKLSWYLLQY